ncbi:MAG: glycosyltransferase [Chloroflexi bacterium]|nr:glycosyltransferase [Chloroflexota bacterium]
MERLKEATNPYCQNILIVDDDQATSTFLRHFFQEKGYSAKAVNSAEAAADVATFQPDAIVIDERVPEADGHNTLTKIRMHSDAPVLLLTALTSAKSTANASNLAGNDYMRRLLYSDELLIRLSALLEERQELAAEQPNIERSGAVLFRQPAVSVVIPAFNEETGLPLVLQAVCGVLDETYEVIVVDDGSSDQTASVAKAFPCRLIQHPHNRGKGAALRTGLQQARGKYVIFLDADNTYPAEAIPALAQLLQHNDLVRGARILNKENIPLLNRMGNHLFDAVVRFANIADGGDILSGMYGGQRDKLLALNLNSEKFDIEAEICIKAKAHKFKCATMPIRYDKRVGETKLNALHDGMRILSRIVKVSLSISPLWLLIQRMLHLADTVRRIERLEEHPDYSPNEVR